jgi:thiamine monophosphate synthase
MPDLARPLLIAITDRHLLRLPPETWASEAIAGGVDLIQVREKDLGEPDLIEFASRILDGTDSVVTPDPSLHPQQSDADRNLEEVYSGVAWGVNPRNRAAGDSNSFSNESRGFDSGLTTKELFQSSTPPSSVSAETSPCEHGVFRPVLASRPQIQVNNAPTIARLFECGLHLPESEPVPDRSPRPLSRSVHSIESADGSTGVDFLIAGHVFATASKSGLAPRGLDWLSSLAASVALPVVAIGGITRENAAACIECGASGIAVISAITGSDDPRSAAAELRTAIDRAWEQRHE